MFRDSYQAPDPILSTKMKNKKRSHGLTTRHPDKYVLYEAAVQDVAHEISFMRRVFKSTRGRKLEFVREDFCGTAKLATAWVQSGPDNRALGVDIDPEPLDWGLRNHVHRAGKAGQRIQLARSNVFEIATPRADAVCAYNFSYFLFKTSASLLSYFKHAYRCIKPDGMLFLDAFGGFQAMTTNKERRLVKGAMAAGGEKVPPFYYEWEHTHFDVLTHDLKCHIHFQLKNGRRLNKAFRYDWRLWTLPEIRELILAAGFRRAEIYTHGLDKEGEGDSRFLQRKRYENEDGWIAYEVGVK